MTFQIESNRDTLGFTVIYWYLVVTLNGNQSWQGGHGTTFPERPLLLGFGGIGGGRLGVLI